VIFKKIASVFLLLMWVFAFSAVCAATPLMVEKNLFATDRKPPSPESLDASSKPAKPSLALGNIQLDGVVFQSGERKAVLRVKNQSAGPPGKKGQAASPFVTVREGQMVSDYRVAKIEPKSISLEKEGQTFTISLFAENKVLSPVTPSAASVQPQAATPPPVAAQQEGDSEQPAGQPGLYPQNQPQAFQNQARTLPPNPGGGRNRNPNFRQQRVQDPAAEQALQDPAVEQDLSQPAETVEEE
jgi:hypothetical protein